MKILVTRPIKEANELAEQLKKIGHEPVICPLFEVNYTQELKSQYLEDYDGIIITSKNAIYSILDINKKVKLFIVGVATYDFIQTLGFTNIIYAGQNILELKNRLQQEKGEFLYLSGKDVTDDLSEFRNITRLVTYEANPLEDISEIFCQFIKKKETKACSLFSFRAAERFLHLVNKYHLHSYCDSIIIFVLSDNIANLFKEANFKACYTPKRSELQSLIIMIDKVLNEQRS